MRMGELCERTNYANGLVPVFTVDCVYCVHFPSAQLRLDSLSSSDRKPSHFAGIRMQEKVEYQYENTHTRTPIREHQYANTNTRVLMFY